MSFVSGDIINVTYTHAVIGSGTLYCKANEDGTLDLGGFRSNDDANMVTGAGQFIDQINRVRSRFELPPISWDQTDRNELDRLSQMAASPILGNWTVSGISGAVWAGNAKPVGDLQGNSNTGQIPLILAGNEFAKIS